MSFRKFTAESFSDSSKSRFSLKPSWKFAALIGVPVTVAGLAGLSYYYYKRNAVKEEPPEPIQTPLDQALSLKNRGNKYFKAGQYNQAIKMYDEGIEMCPEEAVQERAMLYQNRAAARENLKEYEQAVEDCSAALDLSPTYVKALNRRAQLYERMERWEPCLLDATASCIFEKFQNPASLMRMQQSMTKLGQEKEKTEFETRNHSLPSAVFVENYLRSFAWDPFTEACGPVNGDAVDASADSSPFSSAHQSLQRALQLMNEGRFEASRAEVTTAVSLFEKTFSAASVDSVCKADGDDAPETTSDDVVYSEETAMNGAEDEETSAPPAYPRSQVERSRALEALNCARLLAATYMSLAGDSVGAKQLFQSICAADSGAKIGVRVNAMIKSACMAMVIDQDLAACLLGFQNAQDACPECPDVYLHRAQINLMADQLDEALHDLNIAVKLKPEFSIAQAQRLYTMYRRALSDNNLEQVNERLEAFKRLVQKYPNCVESCSLYAQTLMETGRFEESDAEFGRLIELTPNSGMAYVHRGLLYLRCRQDRDTAQRWFAKGIQVDPRCELLHELLGQLASERGDFQNALDHMTKAIEEARSSRDLAHLLAMREGVLAQMRVCEKYNICVRDLVEQMRKQTSQMMMAGGVPG